MTALAMEKTGETKKETLTAQRKDERILYYLNEAAELTLEKVKSGNGKKLNSWQDGKIKEAIN